MRNLKLLLILALFCTACSSKDKDEIPKPDIKFEKAKWAEKDDIQYTYRKQMINDLMNNYTWTDVSKDSLINMLGYPDNIENNVVYMYHYEKKLVLGGVMNNHKALNVELTPDLAKVKTVKLGGGTGWGENQ
jgi:hypothetical protein